MKMKEQRTESPARRTTPRTSKFVLDFLMNRLRKRKVVPWGQQLQKN